MPELSEHELNGIRYLWKARRPGFNQRASIRQVYNLTEQQLRAILRTPWRPDAEEAQP